MITLKSAHEIELMRRAGKITAAARALAGEMVKPGVTTHEIDKAVYRFIKSQGAEPSFLNYSGYPASEKYSGVTPSRLISSPARSRSEVSSQVSRIKSALPPAMTLPATLPCRPLPGTASKSATVA